MQRGGEGGWDCNVVIVKSTQSLCVFPVLCMCVNSVPKPTITILFLIIISFKNILLLFEICNDNYNRTNTLYIYEPHVSHINGGPGTWGPFG